MGRLCQKASHTEMAVGPVLMGPIGLHSITIGKSFARSGVVGVAHAVPSHLAWLHY